MFNRTKFALMAPTAAALALALAACGGGGDPAPKSDQEKVQEYALKQAECMRSHGVDVPDPKPNGGFVISDQDYAPGVVERAMRTCEKEVGRPPAPEMSAIRS